LKITVKTKVTDDSKTKLSAIQSEYQNYQTYLQSGCKQEVTLYSATKQQAQRVLKGIKQPKPKPDKQYPLVLRCDRVDIRKDTKFPGVYWLRIPVYPKSINVRIQTSCKYDLSSNEYSIKECKIVRIEDSWYIYITIEEGRQPIAVSDNVLAIDLGCRNIAVTVNTRNTRPNFYGKVLRDIRGFYFWLRRKLGQKKAFYKIKALGHIEYLRVNHELHEISKAIVEEAKRTNAVIVIGRLKGIRKRVNEENGVSKRLARLINNFPYYSLGQQIKYKAEWAGLSVLEVSESNTSITWV
jgi:IS605 OrfB family transposase